MIAATKRRRNRKPLMTVYGTVSSSGKRCCTACRRL